MSQHPLAHPSLAGHCWRPRVSAIPTSLCSGELSDGWAEVNSCLGPCSWSPPGATAALHRPGPCCCSEPGAPLLDRLFPKPFPGRSSCSSEHTSHVLCMPLIALRDPGAPFSPFYSSQCSITSMNKSFSEQHSLFCSSHTCVSIVSYKIGAIFMLFLHKKLFKDPQKNSLSTNAKNRKFQLVFKLNVYCDCSCTGS